jgi:hypothetical protein
MYSNQNIILDFCQSILKELNANMNLNRIKVIIKIRFKEKKMKRYLNNN